VWIFEVKRSSQKSRDPMQASFFTNYSIDDDTHALVREAIQNSLDARSKKETHQPVRVRFFVGTHDAGSKIMDSYISDEAWKHFNAFDNGLKSPPTRADDCKFLVYEDFHTSGLIGNESATEPEKGNSFYYFMRAEGQSGKDEGERGRHGIGKYVFPYTSRIRMYFAATVRESDSRCLIAGQSVLKSHSVDGVKYTPDGWWGTKLDCGIDDYLQLPIEEESNWLRLKQDFSLNRERTQSGLSLIIPYINDDVDVAKLGEHAVKEFFLPILHNQLIVNIQSENIDF